MFQIILGVVLIVAAVSYVIFVNRRSVAPYVVTPKEDRGTVVQRLGLTKGDKLIELGCGKGDLLFYLVREHKIYSEGIELSLPLYLIAKIRSYLLYDGKVKIHYGDLFKVDLSQYNKVYCYLMKRSYPDLKEKFSQELKPGSRVVVAGWELDSDTPEHKIPKKGEGRFYTYDY